MRRLLLAADVFGYTVAVVGVELIIHTDGPMDAIALVDELALFALGLPVFVIGAKLFGLYDRDEEQADTSTADDLVRVFLLFTVGVFLLTRMPVLFEIAADEVHRVLGGRHRRRDRRPGGGSGAGQAQQRVSQTP